MNRHLARFHFLPPKRYQIVIERQRRQRIQFAHDFLCGKFPLRNVFSVTNLDFVWDRKIIGSGAGAGNAKKYFLPKWISFPRYRFMSGAIGVGFKSSSINFEQNVNSAISADVLIKSGFVGLANATFGERHWCLVQDGASCHMSTQFLNTLFEICNVFPEWPRNSPDLNRIECLWGDKTMAAVGPNLNTRGGNPSNSDRMVGISTRTNRWSCGLILQSHTNGAGS
jgi:hypothetical protein